MLAIQLWGSPPPKSYFFGDERVRFWCFWPDGSSAGFKAMQDTHGSGKEIYCAESMEEMLYSHVNIYVYIYTVCIYIYITDSFSDPAGTAAAVPYCPAVWTYIYCIYRRDSRHRILKIQENLIGHTCIFLITFLFKKCTLRSSERVPL